MPDSQPIHSAMMLDRRAFCFAGLAAGIMPMASHAAGKGENLRSRLGIQLFAVSADMQPEPTGTLKALRKIGYREVEGSPTSSLSAPALRAALDQAGLTCSGIHAPMDTALGGPSLADPAAVIGQARTLGAQYVVVPMVPVFGQIMRRPDAKAALSDPRRLPAILTDAVASMSADDWLAFARRLNELGATMAAAGLRLGYHNHNVEFGRLANGRTIIDLILDNTDPGLVHLELDVGWVAAAGIDPATLMKRHGQRIRQLHLKDIAATDPNIAFIMNGATAGRGTIDWNAVLNAIAHTAVRHAYVEAEPPYDPSPLLVARDSYAFLHRRMVARGV